MIASLLQTCGLDLGPRKELLPPAPNNPEGFWENRSFLRLNDAILKEWGGSWDRPSPMRLADWDCEPGLARLRQKAQDLLDRFNGREPWGWKDPRNCLTLPLWRELLPEIRVLVCVRNPLAVAESLWVRDGISSRDAFNLWLTYNRRVMAAVPLKQRLVTHCESFLGDSHAELPRVLQWVGLSPTPEAVNRAKERISPSLLHHRRTLDDLTRVGGSPDLVECYLELCGEAIRSQNATLALI